MAHICAQACPDATAAREVMEVVTHGQSLATEAVEAWRKEAEPGQAYLR